MLGDGAGKVLHLFERECSVQRRFQKVIEEAPAGHLNPALRDEICAAAVRLSRAAGYRNAGTVEFILAPDGTFYFLEMNTRLQVEHPVTEMVTGLDLVALQLDIAAGRGLALDQADITLTGHALECRVCAEVPEQDFMPATGRILHLDPPSGDNIRFENGLLEGADVTLDFDSMLAKLVVAAPDRPAAIEAARQALERTVLLGVETNLNYLARILAHPAFRDDPLHTGFVAEHEAALAEPDLSPHQAARVLAAAALTFREFRTLAFDAPEPLRLDRRLEKLMKLKLRLNGIPHEMDIAALKPDLELRIDDRGHALRETGGTGARRRARIDGADVTYHQARSGNRAFLHLDGRNWIVEFVDPRDAAREKVQGSGDIRAPMPGVVVSVEKTARRPRHHGRHDPHDRKHETADQPDRRA